MTSGGDQLYPTVVPEQQVIGQTYEIQRPQQSYQKTNL